MTKKLFISTLIFVGLVFLYSAKSRNVKSRVGYINTAELWNDMPAKAQADSLIEQMKGEYVAYYEKQQADFQKQVEFFVKDSANMGELFKQEKLKELLKVQEDINNFPNLVEAELIKKQEELYSKVRVTLQEAIDEVSLEQGYDYVMDVSNLVYAKNKEDDILPLVKNKLGIQSL